jgi:hypothetical protein
MSVRGHAARAARLDSVAVATSRSCAKRLDLALRPRDRGSFRIKEAASGERSNYRRVTKSQLLERRDR